MSDSIQAVTYEILTKDSVLPLIPLLVWDAETSKVLYATRAAVKEFGVELIGLDMGAIACQLHESGSIELGGRVVGYAIARKRSL